ncbi:MAG: queuosine salvage family protein [Candidatus Gribaldobacteria bacterium]|nr:queuosine salvage family protein [Candidatus Gribaldobacteria bacterium]
MLLEKVLSTTQYVAEHSHQVKINQAAIERLAEKIKSQPLPTWDTTIHSAGNPQETAQYIFLLDSLNFCFWADKGQPRWTITHGSKQINGYFALALALKKALKRYPILDANFLAKISRQDFADIFASSNGQTIPLFEKRLAITRQTGQVLAKKYNGQASNIVKAAKKSASKLIELLLRDFPSFRDTAVFGGKKIYLLKRAQILTGDIWGALGGQGLGEFKDIDQLTCFADYKIPQILYHFGILEYSPQLLQKIKNENLITAGSSTEVEIRANTIVAVEMLKKELAKLGRNLPSFQIDWILWNMSQKIKMPTPYHKTRTIYY